MSLQINQLEEAVQRLHVRLQRQIRALYVLHANGNDEAALIALDRVAQINAKIAEMHALLDSFETTADPAIRDDEPTVTYAAEPNGARFRQYAKDPLPPWAIEVEVDDHDQQSGPAQFQPIPLPAQAREEVIIDDPDQDDVEVEYRGTIVATVLLILVALLVALGWSYGRQFLGTAEAIKQTAQMAAVQAEAPAATVPMPPTDLTVTVADVATVTYVVQKGDTLWSIAEQQLGDHTAWGSVYGQNVDIIGDNPDLIFPGQVLTITKVSVGSETIR